MLLSTATAAFGRWGYHATTDIDCGIFLAGRQLEAVRRRVIESRTRSVEMALPRLADRLPPLDPGVVASCWVGAVYEAVYRWLSHPPQERPPANRLADAIASFNLRGIGALIEPKEKEERKP